MTVGATARLGRLAWVSARRICVPPTRPGSRRPLSTYNGLEPTPEPKDIDEFMRDLANTSEEELDNIIGKRVHHSFELQAAAIKMADYFLLYDALDQKILEQELKLRAGNEKDELADDDNEPDSADMSGPELQDGLLDVDQQLLDTLGVGQLKRVQAKIFREWEVDPAELGKYRDQIPLGNDTERSVVSNLKDNNAFKQLLEYTQNNERGLLKKLGLQLITNSADMSLAQMHLIIRQLNLYRYSKPAELALDCLLSSDCPLSLETLVIALKLALSTGNEARFMRYASLVDLNDPEYVKNFDKAAMSSIKPGSWPRQRIDDELKGLMQRFAVGSDAKNVHKYYAHVYGVLMEGFFKFQKFRYVDLAIRRILKAEVPLEAIVFTLNFKVAGLTRDPVRLDWTWRKLVECTELYLANGTFETLLDRQTFEVALVAARRLGQPDLVAQFEKFIDEVVPKSLHMAFPRRAPLVRSTVAVEPTPT